VNQPNLAANGTCLILQINAAYTIGGAGTLTIATAGNITVSNAASTITCPLAFGGTDTIYTNPGAALTLGGNVALIAANLITVNAGTSSAVTFGGTISGATTGTAFTKADTGTLTFSGPNTFTSTGTPSINIGNGTFVAANNSALGGSANTVTVVSGATLAFSGSVTDLNSGVITLNGPGFNNGGAMRNVSGTTLLGRPITLASAASIQSDVGSTLHLFGATISGAFALTLQGTGVGQISEAISTAAGTVTVGRVAQGNAAQNDTGNWIFDGTVANTYTGVTTLNSGLLTLAKSGAVAMNSVSLVIGDGQGGPGGDVVQCTVNNQLLATCVVSVNQASGKFDVNGTTQVCAGLTDSLTTVTGTQGLVTLGAGTLTITHLAAQIFSGTISGTGGIINLNGTAGSQAFLSPNTYTGGTNFTGAAGTLILGDNNALGSGPVTLTTAGVLNSAGPRVISNVLNLGANNLTVSGAGGIAFTSNLTLTANATLTQSNTGIVEFSGNISGAFTLTRAGVQTLRLSGTNTMSGLTISAAAASPLASLQIASDTALGNGSPFTLNITVAGVVLEAINGTRTLPNTTLVTCAAAATTVIFRGSNLILNGTFTIAAATGLTIWNSVTFNNNIQGAFALTKTNAGTITLNGGGNSFTGFTIAGGTVNLGAATALGTAGGTVTISAANPVTIQNTTAAALTFTNPIALNGDFTIAGSQDIL